MTPTIPRQSRTANLRQIPNEPDAINVLPTRLPVAGFATKADEAVFWSAIGPNGERTAAGWAARHGGATLDQVMAKRGISIPKYDSNNPAAVEAWRRAGVELAKGARGNVRVLLADTWRSDSIWADELAALKANPNVDSVRAIDPSTGDEYLLWSR